MNSAGLSDVSIASMAKALGHPARLAILRTLAQRTCVCGEIVDGMPLAQSTVSQHLCRPFRRQHREHGEGARAPSSARHPSDPSAANLRVRGNRGRNATGAVDGIPAPQSAEGGWLDHRSDRWPSHVLRAESGGRYQAPSRAGPVTRAVGEWGRLLGRFQSLLKPFNQRRQ